MTQSKHLKRISLGLLAFLVIGLFAAVAVPPAQAVFKPTDVSNHWAEEYIDELVGQNIVSGYPDGTFRPNQMVNRLEFVIMINRAFKNNKIPATVRFYDVVNERDWFATELGKAVAAGYIAGYTDHTIRPYALINRQEAAFIVAKAAKLDTTVNYPLTFADAANIPLWSRPAIAAMSALGYVNGYPDGTFRPLDYISRAEAAVIITRSLGESIRVFNQAGTYGPNTGTMVIDRDVMITVPGVVLQNIIIEGDLTIAATVGKGNYTLNNVTVQGITTNYN